MVKRFCENHYFYPPRGRVVISVNAATLKYCGMKNAAFYRPEMRLFQPKMRLFRQNEAFWAHHGLFQPKMRLFQPKMRLFQPKMRLFPAFKKNAATANTCQNYRNYNPGGEGVKIVIFEKSLNTLLCGYINIICAKFQLSNPYRFR